MTTESFFEESKEQSEVKSAIVTEYFDVWSSIMLSTQNRSPKHQNKKIAYIDLFAGPGRYSDGTISTPLLVLKKAIQDNELRQRLVTIFNDKDESSTNSLSKAIKELPGIETLQLPTSSLNPRGWRRNHQDVREDAVNSNAVLCGSLGI